MGDAVRRALEHITNLHGMRSKLQDLARRLEAGGKKKKKKKKKKARKSQP
jgi:hypothetical protein